MSLEELRKGLLQEGKSEAAKAKSLAEKRASEIIGAAMQEASKLKEKAKARAEAAIASERNERIGAAQLKAKKIVSEAKNRVIEQALEKIWKEFGAVPNNRAGYEKLMKGIISKAERELGKGAIVSVNARDKTLAKRLAKNVSGENADIEGGAIVSNSDGTVAIDCSLESIFGQDSEKLRKLVYYELFGKGRK
ncbi:V-type ATP synthase subunit E [uncultured archaeon]|nr:V-type ATP synthase subunit E [uncultured archaeon]